MKRDGRPEHQKIAAFYRSLIMSGDLAPGEQLPSMAQLMERHGVAVHTIQRALNVLRDESVEFIDRVSVRLPATHEFEVLGLPGDIPVHRTARTYYTAERVPFEVTVMIQGGHLYGLQYRQPTRESSRVAQ
jgi:DNA-binding GntR family transcriptional regulator